LFDDTAALQPSASKHAGMPILAHKYVYQLATDQCVSTLHVLLDCAVFWLLASFQLGNETLETLKWMREH